MPSPIVVDTLSAEMRLPVTTDFNQFKHKFRFNLLFDKIGFDDDNAKFESQPLRIGYV